jgi:alkaline phosphatase D
MNDPLPTTAVPLPSRRDVLRTACAAAGIGVPAWIVRDQSRPSVPFGVQSGDVYDGAAVIWSRCDRPARMAVEWATNERFSNVQKLAGPAALEPDDFTARVVLPNLPAGERVFYRVVFTDLDDARLVSVPVTGSFRTPPAAGRDVLFAWSGDTAGQGWGIDRDRGGMRTYETMRAHQPDFFLHSGDNIYADGPIQAQVRLDDGTLWKNVVTPEKSKVAETLDEFRGNYRYNLLDDNLRRFNAEVPLFVQWDDHETTNNWYPGERLTADDRYRVKSCDLLSARGRRAFFDYLPIRRDLRDPERIYRSFRYGPSLELFMLDERSYRGPNAGNRQAAEGVDTAFLGTDQMRWLKARLKASTATWKVIASDMPLGLVVGDGPGTYEAWANGDGPPLGREMELAGLLQFLQENRIRNVVWLTADVHYAAAHHYDPSRARFTRFDPFWEFVAGPLHAGNFGPGRLDDTFGPEARYRSMKPGMKQNRPPSDGFQTFGTVRIDGRTEAMAVALYDVAGKRLYSIELAPLRT